MKQRGRNVIKTFLDPKDYSSNPCKPSPSLTILVPLWFIIISFVFFYLCKVLFTGFLQFNDNFVDDQNSSKYRDCAPLRTFALNVSAHPYCADKFTRNVMYESAR